MSDDPTQLKTETPIQVERLDQNQKSSGVLPTQMSESERQPGRGCYWNGTLYAPGQVICAGGTGQGTQYSCDGNTGGWKVGGLC
jgi:hypothetical protein